MEDIFIGDSMRELAEELVAMKRGRCPICHGDLEEIASGMTACTDCNYSD